MNILLRKIAFLITLALWGAGVSLAFAENRTVAPASGNQVRVTAPSGGKSGLASGKDAGEEPEESSLTWGFSGEMSFYGSDYRERGGVESSDELDAGGEISLGASLEWETGSLMHELDVNASGDLTTERDSSKWTFTPGLEYTLMTTTFIVDASVDFNFSSGKDMLLGYMLWMQKKFWKKTDYSLNLSGWVYYRDDGRLLSSAEVNLRKFAKKGLGGKIALGGKIDGDTLVTRMGPAGKLSLSYKFSNGLGLEWNEAVFYGLVTETAYEGCENMNELKFSGDFQVSWKWNWLNVYLTLRSIYRHYEGIPEVYSGAFAENGIYHSVKMGTKVSF